MSSLPSLEIYREDGNLFTRGTVIILQLITENESLGFLSMLCCPFSILTHEGFGSQVDLEPESDV